MFIYVHTHTRSSREKKTLIRGLSLQVFLWYQSTRPSRQLPTRLQSFVAWNPSTTTRHPSRRIVTGRVPESRTPRVDPPSNCFPSGSIGSSLLPRSPMAESRTVVIILPSCSMESRNVVIHMPMYESHIVHLYIYLGHYPMQALIHPSLVSSQSHRVSELGII